MNVQTEKLDNHIARLTVEIEPDQLDKAKKKAARRLARHINIPGFRKGKAPYSVIVSRFGEAPIIEEALDELGNEVYRNALEASEIDPYTSGQLDDFRLDPKPTLVFTVPMQPTVELNTYRDVRVDYELPQVTDENVDDALRRLQEQHALVEQSQSPAALGDRIIADVNGHFVDEDDLDEEPEPAEHDHSAPIHGHDETLYMEEGREPVPGFANELIGVKPGDTRIFTLTYPDDEEKYGEEFSGQTVRFRIDVTKVENVTLPTLNDEFAARVAAEEGDEPPTLLELRSRIRQNIQEQLKTNYENDYFSSVIDEMANRAEFAYPNAMIELHIDGIIEQMIQHLGVTVDDYMRLSQQTPDDIYQDVKFREAAIKEIKRSLIIRGIVDKVGITADDDDINARIDETLLQFGDQADQYRMLFDTPNVRENMTTDILIEKSQDYIVAIGKGEDPQAAIAKPQAEAEDSQTDDEISSEAHTTGQLDSEPTQAGQAAATENQTNTPE